MPKRKRNIKKYMNTRSTMASGVSLSEMFPRYDGSQEEDVYLDISNKVKPYTRTINLVISQHGRVIGNVRMFRRP